MCYCDHSNSRDAAVRSVTKNPPTTATVSTRCSAFHDVRVQGRMGSSVHQSQLRQEATSPNPGMFRYTWRFSQLRYSECTQLNNNAQVKCEARIRRSVKLESDDEDDDSRRFMSHKHVRIFARDFMCWNVWRWELRAVCEELCAVCEELCAVCEELCAVCEELCAVCEELCAVREELCEMCERLCEVWERLCEVCEGLLGSWKDVQMNVCIFYKSNSLFLSKFRSKPARTTTVVVIGYRGSRGYPYIWTWGMLPTPSSIVIRSHWVTQRLSETKQHHKYTSNTSNIPQPNNTQPTQSTTLS